MGGEKNELDVCLLGWLQCRRKRGGTYTTVDFLFRGLDEDKPCAIAHLKRREKVDCYVGEIDPFVAIGNGDHDSAGMGVVQVAQLRLGEANNFGVDVNGHVRCADEDQKGLDKVMGLLPFGIAFLVPLDPAIAILDNSVDHEDQSHVGAVLQDGLQYRENKVGFGNSGFSLMGDLIC